MQKSPVYNNTNFGLTTQVLGIKAWNNLPFEDLADHHSILSGEKIMKTFIALFLTVATSSVFAGPDVQTARTGLPLDVAKTISITDTSQACGVVEAEMVYLDSEGVQHIATYLVQGGGCSSN